jgi:hypothetical protein
MRWLALLHFQLLNLIESGNLSNNFLCKIPASYPSIPVA